MSTNITTTAYSNNDISLIQNEMNNRWVMFKAELMKSIEELKTEDGVPLDAKMMIDFYYQTTQNAMKVNPKTGDMIEDTETRMKAMDKLIKLMTDNSKWWLTINIQNNTSIWDNMPQKWAHLIY